MEWSRDHVVGHQVCHHCHQVPTQSGLWPAPARFGAGPCSPAPIGPKVGEGRLLGGPEGPAKSGADRGGPCRPPGGGGSVWEAKGIDQTLNLSGGGGGGREKRN